MWSTGPGRLVLVLAVAAVLAALTVPTIAMVRLMSPSEQQQASQTVLDQTHVGGPITAVVRIDAKNSDGTFNATFLQPLGSNTYRVTSQQLRIQLAGDITYAMGDAGSMRPGAVVQVKGALSAVGEITAHDVVGLTGFVTVKS